MPKQPQTVHENEMLLSVINDIATSSNKLNILQLIQPKLKELFQTEDIFICRLDNETETIQPFLRVASESRQRFPEYARVLTGMFSIHERFISHILQSKQPVQYDLEAVCNWPGAPYYAKISYAAGIRESISTALHYGDQVLGVLTLWSDKKGAFKQHHKKLILKVADQVAIILSNISDNEKIRQKEKENQVLMAVSHAIAAIRNKNDMITAIQKTLQSALQFSDIAITKFNLEKQTFRVFLESCEKTSQHPDFQDIAFREYPIADGIHDVIMNSEKAVVLSVRDLLDKGMVHIEFLQQAGIKELAGIRLKHNNNIIGTMVLLSAEDNSFSRSDRRLLEEVSHHFATAMVNIIYHEEIRERSRKNEILLSTASAFSSIRDKQDLLQILRQQLESLSFYSDISISKIDSNNKTFSAFLVNEHSSRQTDSRYPQMRAAHHPYPDGVFEVALRSRRPVIFDIDEILGQGNAPSYIRFLHENGTVEMVGISLRDRNREIGVLFVFANKKRTFSELQFNIVQGIGNQLGTTVANILANEEIRMRDQEKSVLLNFIKDIAGVRNKDDLFSVVKDRMGELFGAKGFAIGLINDDGDTHSVYLFDLEDRIRNHEDFNSVIQNRHPIRDGYFDEVLGSIQAVTFIVSNITGSDQIPMYVQFWQQVGIEVAVGSPLRVGNNKLGVLFFHTEAANTETITSKLNLLQGISAQISIALSNILANERIVRQMAEISRYKEQLEEEKQYLQEEVSSAYAYNEIIGASVSMQQVFQLLSQVSYASSTVLILGETGTGKELIARAIHNTSPRKDNLMVKVNCAVLPLNLIESELFGHEKGSFTGATERRIGKFELANNGTLFLDEIGELPNDLQVKLLRAIQEKEIERIGGKSTIKVNVRIITATNRDLQKEVDEGRFRRDLYYRLNVFPVSLPALRDRKEDIPSLVAHFIDKYSRTTGKKINNISARAMKQLFAYNWPGNVRELEHLIERSVLLADTSMIKEVHLPVNNKQELKNSLKEQYLKSHEENERDHIISVLNECNGKIFGTGGAAEILKLPVSTLNSKIKKLGIRKNKMFT
ncbi:sigma 54-interacting transcriptional regulator [Flavihumibacter solisilvae]|nr:sigma 54-interacting transcriptional regulator [Flavihumibacter solisilvae]